MVFSKTKIIKIISHSLLLTFLNLGSIIFGFTIYHFLKPINQLIIQAPVASLSSIILFILWIICIRRFNIKTLIIDRWAELFWIFSISFIWIPAIFVPIHYITQGYLTSFSNILWVWVYQTPTNLVPILIIGKFFLKSKINK